MKKMFVVALAVVTIMFVVPTKVEAAEESNSSSSYGKSGSALGLGWGITFNEDDVSFGNFHLTGKISSSAVMFGIDIDFGREVTGFDFSLDWWLLNPTLGSIGIVNVSLYLGPGIDIGIDFGNSKNPFSISLGGRIPLGISWCIGNFEIFTEFLFAMHFLDIGFGEDSYVKLFGVDVDNGEENFVGTLDGAFNFGFRYWF